MSVPADHSLASRVAALEAAAACVQIDGLPSSPLPAPVARVRDAALSAGCLGCALVRVPLEYYSLPLARAEVLRTSPARLCKTLVFENAAAPPPTTPLAPASALHLHRHFAVLLQYTARLDVAALERALRASAASDGVEGYAPRLALAPDAEALTGFVHGAVAPLGSLTPLPLFLCTAALSLKGALFAGGGAQDVKLRVFAAQLRALPHCVALDRITTPRKGGEEEEEE